MNENKGYRRLMMSAAVSLVVLCSLGIGSVMGWWPPPPPTSENAVAAAQGEQDSAELTAVAGCSVCGVIESIRVETVLVKSPVIGAAADNAEDADNLDGETRKGIRQQTDFRILVRMADGTHRTLYIGAQNFTVGQKVKVINGHIVPYSNS